MYTNNSLLVLQGDEIESKTYSKIDTTKSRLEFVKEEYRSDRYFLCDNRYILGKYTR